MSDDMGVFRTSVAIAPLAIAPISRVIENVVVDTGAELVPTGPAPAASATRLCA
jgi:hypothetical protein